MRVTFYESEKEGEKLLGLAFCHGVRSLGDECRRESTAEYQLPDPETDVAVVFGVKGQSRRIMDDHTTLGLPTVYIDKGYLQKTASVSNRLSRAFYYKVSVGFQPLDHLAPECSDRWDAIAPFWGPEIEPWRTDGDHVLWLGPSQKYCDFHGLGDANEYSTRVIERIRRTTSRQVVYRPKHSWNAAVPVDGTVFSRSKKVTSDLAGAWAAVTHGSNSSVLAIVHGIPVVTLGPAITRPLASRSVEALPAIGCPTDERRMQWLHTICYWQWSIAEIHDGATWRHLRRHL